MFSKLPTWLAKPDPNILLSDNYVVLDGEITRRGLDAKHSSLAIYPTNDVVCFSWYTSWDDTLHTIYGSEYEMYPMVKDCMEADLLVGHNIKFDLQWLKRCGYNLRAKPIYDTMIGEYVLTGNKLAGLKGALTLDTLAKQYIGHGKEPFIDKLMRNGVCPSEMPKSMLIERNRCDVEQTRQIFLIQRRKLRCQKLLPVMFTRCILTPCLADIEMRGVHLDKTRVLGEYNAAVETRDRVMAELEGLLGGRNPRSVLQMKELIYDVLKFPPVKKGRNLLYPTGEEVLAFVPKTKAQERFLRLKKEFSQVNADLTKNLEYFYGVVTEQKDALFYAQFNQTVTQTHRLSSSGISFKFSMYKDAKSIQLQNSPRKYKTLYSARNKGWLVAEADGAQIEFRVAGFVGQDVAICQALVDDFDVHTFTASVLNDTTEADIRTWDNYKLLRTAAKPDTFKPLYGGQFGTEAQMRYYAAFREKYAGITDAQRRWEDEALATKKLKTCTGLTFYYPDARITGSGYNPQFPSICNYTVQMLATADIVPIALVALWHLMDSMLGFLVNTVHDSVVAELPPEEVDEWHNKAKWCFLDWVYYYLKEVYHLDFNIPLGIGFEAGEHWSEGEEIKTVVLPPVRMKGVDYSNMEK